MEGIMDGKEIRRKRKMLGMSQEALAAALGVSRNTVARWENLKMKVEHGKLIEIALNYLGIKG
jgi:transcriptional regulator with XRE-family HTH domain